MFMQNIELFDWYIEISSWEVLTYGIYARVNLFSQNERASEF